MKPKLTKTLLRAFAACAIAALAIAALLPPTVSFAKKSAVPPTVTLTNAELSDSTAGRTLDDNKVRARFNAVGVSAADDKYKINFNISEDFVILSSFFKTYRGLTSISFPATLTSIGDSAFEMLTNLDSIEFAANGKLTKIGTGAFYSCSKISGAVSFPEGLIEIGGNAFFDCRAIESLILPSTLTGIGKSAFRDCVGLKSLKMNESAALTIEERAFMDCALSGVLRIGANTVSIGSEAFSGTAIYAIDVDIDSRVSVGEKAFSSVKITIPDKLIFKIGAKELQTNILMSYGSTGIAEYNDKMSSVNDRGIVPFIYDGKGTITWQRPDDDRMDMEYTFTTPYKIKNGDANIILSGVVVQSYGFASSYAWVWAALIFALAAIAAGIVIIVLVVRYRRKKREEEARRLAAKKRKCK